MKFHWMHRFDFGNRERELVYMAETLEKSKAYSVLLTYSFGSPDYVPFLPSMIKATKQIKFMLALRSYTISPEYAIRIFQTMQNNYGGRLTFNLVAGKMVDHEEKEAIEMYNFDKSLIDTVDKRIDLADKWADKFFNFYTQKNLRPPISYTIGNSPITLELGNKWTDYVIIHEGRLEESFNGAKNTKLVLTIDPLIRETKEELDQDIEYYKQSWKTNLGEKPVVLEKQKHSIRGNMEEVKKQITDISKKYGIEDFMIVTSQKDISSLLRLMEEMSS